MTTDLFGHSPGHDPGGKVRYALPAGLSGDAELSACGVYRPVLRRWTGPIFPLDDYALWIGMTPSTAAAADSSSVAPSTDRYCSGTGAPGRPP